MSNNIGTTKSFDLGDGRIVSIETGKLAKQADGAVVIKMGDTMLLATAVGAKDSKDGVDFMPLSCEYKEKYAAVGRFPGGFLKREGRTTDYEILVSRLVDRALRPLFPEDFHADVFVTVTLISADKDIMPDALAGLAASAALAVSDIPFNGPISEVRVARINGEFKINPTFSENAKADLDIMVAATMDNIMMVEGEMKEVSEEVMLAAIKVAHDAIKIQCKAQLELVEMLGGRPKRTYSHEPSDEALKAQMHKAIYDKAYDIAGRGIANKNERGQAFKKLKDEFLASLPEGTELNKFLVDKYHHDVEKEAVRNRILNDGLRLDGRKTEEIRAIWGEVGYLPAAHGSAIFTRGETQSLTTVTLGTRMDEQQLDGAMIKGTEKFILHYNFPPFSTNDAKASRGVGRREIGHGNLAFRALAQVLSKDENVNPYTVRVVSDILESNGSSSMATVCAGCLALMDAGVKISKPVSGIAMGLISEKGSKRFAVLSDILGDEDHLGDMDFKVTGTKDGITATQMDIKVDGLSYEVLSQALDQARKGRLHILGKMDEVISEPRAEYKPQVPRMEKLTIPKEFIGAIIGPGGKVIQEMQKETGAVITIEEKGDVGIVTVSSSDLSSVEAVKARIKGIVAIPEIGEVYNGTVKNITAFGAFIEILPGKDALLHISEIDWTHVTDIAPYMKTGDKVDVKLVGVDEKTGKLKLSRKVLLPKPENN